MRALLSLFACLLLVFTAWGGVARASGPACSETADQIAVHVAGDCDEVPADSDRNYAHCHTGCHGHHVAAPIPARAIGAVPPVDRAYASVSQPTLTGHQVDQALRPPQA